MKTNIAELAHAALRAGEGSDEAWQLLLAVAGRVDGWKGHINRRFAVPGRDLAAVEKAIDQVVVDYTGSVPSFTVVDASDSTVLLTVRAAGYYETIGA